MSDNPRALPWGVLREGAGLSVGQVVALARAAGVRGITRRWLSILEAPGEPHVHPSAAQLAWLRETYGAEDQEALQPLLDRLRARALHPRPGQAYLDSLVPGARALVRGWYLAALGVLEDRGRRNPPLLTAHVDLLAARASRHREEPDQHRPIARGWLAEPLEVRRDVTAIVLEALLVRRGPPAPGPTLHPACQPIADEHGRVVAWICRGRRSASTETG